MSDERCERYDEALRRAKGLGGIFEDFSKEIEAVMAVADAELDSVHQSLAEERDVAVRMEAENARLRAELETARVDGHRLIRAEQRRAELEAVIQTHRKDDQAENARLLDWIRQEQQYTRDVDTARHSAFATIECVRAVLDRTTADAYVTNYSRERERAIRAALDGNS